MEKIIITQEALKNFLRILFSTPTCQFPDNSAKRTLIRLYHNPCEIEIKRLFPLCSSGGPVTLFGYAQENSLEKIYPGDILFLFGGNFHIHQVNQWLKNGQTKNNFWLARKYKEEHFFGDMGNVLVVKKITNPVEALYQNGSLKIEVKGLIAPLDLILRKDSYIFAHFAAIVAICDGITAREILHLQKKNTLLLKSYS